MEYMGAVYDAENALYACNEAIAELEERRVQTQEIQCARPVEPKKAAPEVFRREVTEKEIKGTGAIRAVGAVVGLILGWMIATVTQDENGYVPLVSAVFICPLLGAFLPVALMKLNARQEFSVECKQAQEAAEAKTERAYQREMEEYKGQMVVYERAQSVEKAVQEEIEEAIQANTCMAERIKGELQQLYDRNIIHATFRNMVAVNQIREYLDMGICDDLGGANGAYAQYMLDVRTDRICNSIEELKRNMLRVLEKIAVSQSMLVSEIRCTNENLASLQTSIDQGFSNIQRQMQHAQRDAAVQTGKLDEHFAEMNVQVEEMRKALSASAHNQYVALRETNVRKYLKKYELDANQLS